MLLFIKIIFFIIILKYEKNIISKETFDYFLKHFAYLGFDWTRSTRVKYHEIFKNEIFFNFHFFSSFIKKYLIKRNIESKGCYERTVDKCKIRA